MSKLFRQFLDFLIYSNLFIAVAAVMLTIEAQVQLGMPPSFHPYLLLILFATLFEYNLHKFVAVFFYKHALEEPKFKWIAQNLKLFYLIFFSSVIGFLITVFFARWVVLFTLLPLGIITFLYSFPVYKKGIRIFRLREVPLAKIFIISLVWAATSIILPVVHSDLQVDAGNTLLLIFERFLFVFAITVPFDIRDMESDEKSGLKTLPLLIGEHTSIRIANASMILFLSVSAVHYAITDQFWILAAFLISGLSTLYFLNSERIRKFQNYHYGVLDGTMTLQGMLVLIFYFLF